MSSSQRILALRPRTTPPNLINPGIHIEAEDLVWGYVSLVDMEAREKCLVGQRSPIHPSGFINLGLALSLAVVFFLIVFGCMIHSGLVSSSDMHPTVLGFRLAITFPTMQRRYEVPCPSCHRLCPLMVSRSLGLPGGKMEREMMGLYKCEDPFLVHTTKRARR